jgi:hypothetical protein
MDDLVSTLLCLAFLILPSIVLVAIISGKIKGVVRRIEVADPKSGRLTPSSSTTQQPPKTGVLAN